MILFKPLSLPTSLLFQQIYWFAEDKVDLIAPMPPANQTQNEKVGGLIPKKNTKKTVGGGLPPRWGWLETWQDNYRVVVSWGFWISPQERGSFFRPICQVLATTTMSHKNKMEKNGEFMMASQDSKMEGATFWGFLLRITFIPSIGF